MNHSNAQTAPAQAPPQAWVLAPRTREQGARWATGLLVVAALVLGQLNGGFEARVWGPAAIVLLWLAVGTWAFARPTQTSPRVRFTLLAYGALTVWTAASILWADTPLRALEATGRTALYGLALAVVLLPRWPRESLRRLVVLVAIGSTVLATVTLLRVALAADPSSLFIDGRLVAPAGYVNAAAGLWVIAFPVLIGLAAGGVRNPVGRVAALGAAGLVFQLGLLSQSRGALIATAVAVVVLIALSPNRGPLLLATAAALAAAGLAAGAIVDVRGAPDIATLVGRLNHASSQMVFTLAGLVVAGALWQVAVQRASPGLRAAVTSPRTGNAAATVVSLLAVIGLIVVVGNPVSWASGRVDEALHGGYDNVAPTGDRLTGSLGSGRGDMYRVALREWRDHPIQGIGAEDFQPAYLQDRRSTNAPRYAHSLPLGILVGLGTVGALLALTVLIAIAAAVIRALRGTTAATRAVVAVAVAGAVGWLVQATWDWTWEFPALTILAFVLIGAASRATDTAGEAPSAELLGVRERARFHGVAVPDDDEPDVPVVPRSVGGRAVAAGLLAAATLATFGFASIGLSSFFFHRGTSQAASDPAAAAYSFARAARFNPLDGDATLSRAILLRRLGDDTGWRDELVRTIERSPNDWLAHLELGIADVPVEARRRAGYEHLRTARALNPSQPVIQETIDALRAEQVVEASKVEARLAERQSLLEHPVAGS